MAKWGFGHGDKGFKNWMENQYYGAVSKYDKSYNGISCQDFVECNFLFDYDAMKSIK